MQSFDIVHLGKNKDPADALMSHHDGFAHIGTDICQGWWIRVTDGHLIAAVVGGHVPHAVSEGIAVDHLIIALMQPPATRATIVLNTVDLCGPRQQRADNGS